MLASAAAAGPASVCRRLCTTARTGIRVVRHAVAAGAGSSRVRGGAHTRPLAHLQDACTGSSRVAAPRLQRACSNRRPTVACAADSTTVELDLKVEGMKCGGCSSRVEAVLKAMDHVTAVRVDLDTKLATVEVEAATLIDAMNMLPTFVSTIKELGFEAEPHIEFEVPQQQA